MTAGGQDDQTVHVFLRWRGAGVHSLHFCS
jgi:hypothetical protein